MVRTTIKTVLAVLLLCGAGKVIRGAAPQGKLPSFDVISVKPSAPGVQPRALTPMGPGDVYVQNGGHFAAQGYPLVTYLAFAFRLVGSELDSVMRQLPGWAVSDRFSIEARTDGDPSKDTMDEMRLMMRSLLVERFGLKTHYETRSTAIFAVALAKAGRMGPQLQRHPAVAVCNKVLTPAGAAALLLTDVAGIYPKQCGGMMPLPASAAGRYRFGARDVTMEFIVKQLTSLGDLGRPAVNQTGLNGTFDFVLEFVPEISQLPGRDFSPDPDGPTFSEAVREQLGLKLVSTKGRSQFLVIDHVEHPTKN